jgi:hypothetical protein
LALSGSFKGWFSRIVPTSILAFFFIFFFCAFSFVLVIGFIFAFAFILLLFLLLLLFFLLFLLYGALLSESLAYSNHPWRALEHCGLRGRTK